MYGVIWNVLESHRKVLCHSTSYYVILEWSGVYVMSEVHGLLWNILDRSG